MRDMITRIREALGSIIISIVGQGSAQTYEMQLRPVRVRNGGARWTR
jgi:hypothetical protein